MEITDFRLFKYIFVSSVAETKVLIAIKDKSS